MKSPTPERAVLTVEELAERLGIGRNGAYEAIRRNEIPGVIRIGRNIRIGRAACDAWLAGRDDGER